MKKFAFALLFALASFSVVAAPSVQDKSFSQATDTVVLREDFVLFNFTDPTQPPFKRTSVVPLIENQAYGWIMKISTTKQKVKWREEFVLPAKPVTWGVDEPIGTREIKSDSRVSVTEREVVPQNGVILNSWTVAPGDPKGRYIIRVSVEGGPAKTFEFDVR